MVLLDAKEDAKLIYGLKQEISREDFIQAIKKGTIIDTLNEIRVKAGDCLYISSGTVHAILEDILIAEFQQNSNTTFRIFDWDRVDKHGNKRELHIDRALDVIDFNTKKARVSNSKQRMRLIESEYFIVDEISIENKQIINVSEEAFRVIMNISGSGKMYWKNGSETINKGDTVLIPAGLGELEIEGKLKILCTYVV